MPSTTRSNRRVAAHESASGWAARKAGLKAQSTGRLRSPLRVDGRVQPYHRCAEATGKRDGRADQIDGLAALPVRRQSATRASAASAPGSYSTAATPTTAPAVTRTRLVVAPPVSDHHPSAGRPGGSSASCDVLQTCSTTSVSPGVAGRSMMVSDGMAVACIAVRSFRHCGCPVPAHPESISGWSVQLPFRRAHPPHHPAPLGRVAGRLKSISAGCADGAHVS